MVGLRAALEDLKNAGCRTAYVDGSFVTIKAIPNDYDACWDEDGVDPVLLDPVLLTFGAGRAAQKERATHSAVLRRGAGRRDQERAAVPDHQGDAEHGVDRRDVLVLADGGSELDEPPDAFAALQIQRYEATDYASASLTRIREVAGALGASER